MRWRRERVLTLALVALVGGIVACSGAPTVPTSKDYHELTETWSAPLPEGDHRWEVQLADGCIFAIGIPPGSALQRGETARHVHCYEAPTGELVWQRQLPGPRGGQGERFWVTEEHLIHVTSRGVRSYAHGDGALVWEFDTGEREVRGSVIDGGALFVLLNGDLLVALDDETGAWLKGVRVHESELVGVAGGVPIVAATAGARWAQPTLLGLNLDVAGGEAPDATFPAAKLSWTLPIGLAREAWSHGDVVVGKFGDSHLWGVSSADGELLYKAPLRVPRLNTPVPTTRRKKKSRKQSARVASRDFDEPPIFGRGQRVLTGGEGLLFTSGSHEGVAMDVRRIDAHAMDSLDFVWSFSAPGWQHVQLRTVPSMGAIAIFRGRQVWVRQASNGAALWSATFDRKVPDDWTDIATEGSHVFMIAPIDNGALLKAVALPAL